MLKTSVAQSRFNLLDGINYIKDMRTYDARMLSTMTLRLSRSKPEAVFFNNIRSDRAR